LPVSRTDYVTAPTDIEHTTGAKVSLIHLLMFGEVALPLLAGLFLEINALIIALMIVAFLAHEVTALWDVSYAVTRRYVSPVEQIPRNDPADGRRLCRGPALAAIPGAVRYGR
jgi:hypothetical protein